MSIREEVDDLLVDLQEVEEQLTELTIFVRGMIADLAQKQYQLDQMGDYNE